MTYSKILVDAPMGTLKCAICHNDIKQDNHLYQSERNKSIVCPNCWKLFSKEDIELIIDLFFAYGGYFGKNDSSDFSVNEILKNLTQESESDLDLDQLNIKLLHKALLCGITPEDFVKKLNEILMS